MFEKNIANSPNPIHLFYVSMYNKNELWTTIHCWFICFN